MKKYSALILFFLIIIFVFPVSSFAKPLRVTIYPKKISPGDAFVIKVTGVRTSLSPSVLFMKKEMPLSNCGKGCYLAIGAVDIETKPKSYAVTVKAGNRKRSLKLLVKRKKFPELCLTLPDEKVTPSPENLKRVEDENKKLAEIFQNVSEELWDGKFIVAAGK